MALSRNPEKHRRLKLKEPESTRRIMNGGNGMDDFGKHLKRSLQDPAFAAEYEKQRLYREIITVQTLLFIQGYTFRS